MMKGQLAGLMKQAQAMQDNLKRAQDELALLEVEGQSGAGLVKVAGSGRAGRLLTPAWILQIPRRSRRGHGQR